MNTGILIIAHAPLASALRECVLHVYPETANGVLALDVLPNASTDITRAAAQALLQQLGAPNTLVLTDVFGATPSNVAQRLADGVQVCVIAGVNVPMLWRSLCYATEPLAAVVGRALAGATQGVRLVAASIADNQTIKTDSNDKNDAHHQQ